MGILFAALLACSADVTQADDFLRLIRSQPRAEALADFVQLPGTRLIIAQQNVSRSVTSDEYREALTAALNGSAPNLPRRAAGSREARGIEGLLNDVVPSIRWAAQNTDLLTQRLERFRKPDLCDARKRAARYLPARSDAQVNLYVVMGGRAGAAAIGNDICFDGRDGERRRDPEVGGTGVEEGGSLTGNTPHVAGAVMLAEIDRGVRLPRSAPGDARPAAAAGHVQPRRIEARGARDLSLQT